MALQKALSTEHGIELPQAYIRIDEYGGNKNLLHITVGWYKDVDSATNNFPPVVVCAYSFVPDTSEQAINYHTQGYNYLKTEENYVGAVDV